MGSAKTSTSVQVPASTQVKSIAAEAASTKSRPTAGRLSAGRLSAGRLSVGADSSAIPIASGQQVCVLRIPLEPGLRISTGRVDLPMLLLRGLDREFRQQRRDA